ncbi:hypothetical protein P171DRAFT_502867, partial [Karstenula rhodostoma CBS 690.94]
GAHVSPDAPPHQRNPVSRLRLYRLHHEPALARRHFSRAAAAAARELSHRVNGFQLSFPRWRSRSRQSGRKHICSSCHSTSHGAHECTNIPGIINTIIEDIPRPSASSLSTTNPQSLTTAHPAIYPSISPNYLYPPPAWTDTNTNNPTHICENHNLPTTCTGPACHRRHVCSNCHSPYHTLPACTNYPAYICDKFNAESGCLFAHCQRRHVCSNCHSSAHSVMLCSNYPEYVCERFNGVAGCLWKGCMR